MKIRPLRRADGYLFIEDSGVTHMLGHTRALGWHRLCDPALDVCSDCVTYGPESPLCGACVAADAAAADFEASR